VKTDADNWQELNDQIAILGQSGIHVRHIFPPNELLVYVSQSIEPITFGQNFVVESLGESDYAAAETDWRVSCSRLALSHLMTAAYNADTLAYDRMLLTHESEPDASFNQARSTLVSPALQYTANFMVGRAAVCVIFPESRGNDENWTDLAKQSAFSRVVQGLDWWCEQAEQRNVSLAFVYEIHWEIPVNFEPAKDPAPIFSAAGCIPYSRWDWVDEIQHSLGYSSDWDGAFAHCNDLRQTYSCNWAFDLHIANAEYEPGHVFYGMGRPGYANPYTRWDYVRCKHYQERPTPSVAVAYSSAYSEVFWGFVAHKTGHVFGGVDEYEQDGGQCNSGGCDDLWGYLQIKNGNCVSCNQHSAGCMMKDYSASLCDSTLGHLGWRDSDGDGVSDAIQPNCGGWQSIPNVCPGDLVRIYTLAFDFVNSIAVTADNMATQPANYIIWDGHNYDDQICAINQTFYVTINNGSPFTLRLNSGDPSNTPAFTDISYSNGNLNWNLDNSFAYVRCFIYDAADNLIARPIWDKLYTAHYPQSLNMDFLPSGQTFIARFFGWCPDGGKSETVNYSFTHQCNRCGDADGSGMINISDAVYLIAYIFAHGATPGDCRYATGLGDSDGNGQINISDAVFLIAYIFANGTMPHCQ